MGANSSTLMEDAMEGVEEEAAAPAGLHGVTPGRPPQHEHAVKLYRYDDGQWVKELSSAVPDFYDENDDETEPSYCMDIGPRLSIQITEDLRMAIDSARSLASFLAPDGIIYAVRFATREGLLRFKAKYEDAVFANKYRLAPTDENKQRIYGDYADWGTGQDAEDAEWEEEEPEGPSMGERRMHEERATGAPGHGSTRKASQLQMGALENSFLLREGELDVYRNVEGGLTDAGATVALQSGPNSYLTPKKAILTQRERNMMLLSPDAGESSSAALRQLDIESGKMVATWAFKQHDVDQMMVDIMPDSKEAQMDAGHSTFMSLGKNKICRWDMRVRDGLVQEMSSPTTLEFVAGKMNYSKTSFRCMATTGAGNVATGDDSGVVRLYKSSTLGQAKTNFPGLGMPVTAIDVSYDGKWVLATTDTYLMLIYTVYTDKNGSSTTGFQSKMGQAISAPRLLKLLPPDVKRAGGAPFTKARFSWITEQGKEERWIVATCGKYSVLFNFKRLKQVCRPGSGANQFSEYHMIEKDETVLESSFMHDAYVAQDVDDQLVVATESGDVYSCAG